MSGRHSGEEVHTSGAFEISLHQIDGIAFCLEDFHGSDMPLQEHDLDNIIECAEAAKEYLNDE